MLQGFAKYLAASTARFCVLDIKYDSLKTQAELRSKVRRVASIAVGLHVRDYSKALALNAGGELL